MNIGVSVPLPAYLVDVGAMARKAEELGFESFWCAEHPFIPVRTESRFPGSPDGIIPEEYSHFVDPFVALARASGTTSRIKLAPGLVLVPERHPLVLAPRGDPDHGRRLRSPLDADAGVGPRHEGAVDEDRGRVPRQVL